jgi:hypothetical protein
MSKKYVTPLVERDALGRRGDDATRRIHLVGAALGDAAGRQLARAPLFGELGRTGRRWVTRLGRLREREVGAVARGRDVVPARVGVEALRGLVTRLVREREGLRALGRRRVAGAGPFDLPGVVLPAGGDHVAAALVAVGAARVGLARVPGLGLRGGTLPRRRRVVRAVAAPRARGRHRDRHDERGASSPLLGATSTGNVTRGALLIHGRGSVGLAQAGTRTGPFRGLTPLRNKSRARPRSSRRPAEGQRGVCGIARPTCSPMA